MTDLRQTKGNLARVNDKLKTLVNEYDRLIYLTRLMGALSVTTPVKKWDQAMQIAEGGDTP